MEQSCPACGFCNKQGDEYCFSCNVALSKKRNLSSTEEQEPSLLHQRYHLQRMVGAGGFSTVYLAKDTTTGALVAVKSISLRGLTLQEKLEATDAFNREVHLLSTLHHPNLSHVLDYFTDKECWYMVLDFIQGTTLEERLEQSSSRRLPFAEIVALGLTLCDVLEYLHSQQPPIIYRDLKPANIMLTPQRHLFLIDFGIARLFQPNKVKDTISFGSPGYAAPEQYGKAQTTPRTDIYSLGVLLYQLLSGDDPTLHPFTFAPLNLQQPNPKTLETLIMQMVALRSEDRPENIQVIKKELQRCSLPPYLQGLPASQKRPSFKPAGSSSALPPLSSPEASARRGGQIMVKQTKQPGSVATPNAGGGDFGGVASFFLGMLGGCAPMIVMPIVGSLTNDPVFTVSALLFCFIPSVFGIFLGHRARRRAKRTQNPEQMGCAAIGLLTSYIMAYLWAMIDLAILSAR